MNAEQAYENELAKLRKIAARRDWSPEGDAEYAAQHRIVKVAYWAAVRADMAADLARGKKPIKKAKGMK